MRPNGTGQQLEKRRRQAIRLLKQGKNLPEVSRALSASVSSVFRWWQSYQKSGWKGLEPHPTPGRPPKLSSRQKKQLANILLAGSEASGYLSGLWTLKRVAKVIQKRFGIRYHPRHVWRVLQGMGWSCQKPERRAKQRDEKAIKAWKQTQWPRIKKSPNSRRASRVS